MEAFLIYIFKSSIILSLFYLVYFLLLRKDTFFIVNRHFLLLGIICSIIFPFLEFTTIEYIEQPVIQEFEFSTISSNIQPQETSALESLDWWFIGFCSYLAILGVLLGRFGIQLLSLKKAFSNTIKKSNEGFLFIKTSKHIAPFSFFKYIIFNPTLHTSTELDLILKHEKVHAQQYHTFDLLVMHLASIFQWINPLVWTYKKGLEQNLEFIADQESTRDLSSKTAYQLALVKVSAGNYSALTNNFYQSLIKKRIVMLNKKQSSHKNLWKVTVIIPLLSLFLWSFNTKTEIKYLPSSVVEKNITTEETPNEVISLIPKEESLTKEKEKNTYPAKRIPAKKVMNTKKTPQIVTKNKTIAAANTFFPAKESINVIAPPSKTKKGTIEFIINKSSTQEDLDRVQRIFKNEYAVEIKFSNIQRNSDDEITAISIAMNSKKSNANFSVENEEPITSIVISYDSKKEKMGIGQSGGKNVWFKSKKGKKGVTVFEFDGDEAEGTNVFVNKDKKYKGKIVVRNSDKDKNVFIHSNGSNTVFDFDGDSDKEPLFIIDGKEATRKEVKKLNSKKIESIEVIKGDKAIEKHGKKGKDGVIDIVTKKNIKKGTGFLFKTNSKNRVTGISKNDNVFTRVYKNSYAITPQKISKSNDLVYVNGKRITPDQLKNINTNSIQSINVLKNDAAVIKYGTNVNDKVLEIVTKK